MKTTKFFLPLLALGLAAGLTTGAYAQSGAPAPAPTQVYVAQLPTPTELINAAGAQQMSVDKIEQRSDQVTAVYHSANGQTSTVIYMPLPANEAAAAAAPAASATHSTTVIYGTPAYAPAPYYYPWGWYPPVSIGFGFGWRGGWGGWHGRWR